MIYPFVKKPPYLLKLNYVKTHIVNTFYSILVGDNCNNLPIVHCFILQGTTTAVLITPTPKRYQKKGASSLQQEICPYPRLSPYSVQLCLLRMLRRDLPTHLRAKNKKGTIRIWWSAGGRWPRSLKNFLSKPFV